MPRVLVVGFDGMDPRIVNKLLNNGQLPNFAKLMQKGI